MDLIHKAVDDCFVFSIIVYYFAASLILNSRQNANQSRVTR